MLRKKSISQLWKIAFRFSDAEYNGFDKVEGLQKFRIYTRLRGSRLFSEADLELTRLNILNLNFSESLLVGVHNILSELCFGPGIYIDSPTPTNLPDKGVYKPHHVLAAIIELDSDYDTHERCFNRNLLRWKLDKLTYQQPDYPVKKVAQARRDELTAVLDIRLRAP